jgi:hypothetical protein
VLEVQGVGRTAGAVEDDTQGVGGELTVEPSAQAVAVLGMVLLHVQLGAELVVHRLHDLAPVGMQRHHGRGELVALIGAGHCEEGHPGPLPQGGGDGGADVALVTQDQPVVVGGEQLGARVQIRNVGRGQFEVEDHPTQSD